MPTYAIPKRLYPAGRTEYAVPIFIMGDIQSAKIALVFDPDILTDPATHVQMGIEWSADGMSGWRHVASAGFDGYPNCPPSAAPYVRITSSFFNKHRGHYLRFYLQTDSPLSIGATITVT